MEKLEVLKKFGTVGMKISETVKNAFEHAVEFAEKKTKTAAVILVIGQPGVGSRSLISLMYRELKKKRPFSFKASEDTHNAMEKAFEQILYLVNPSDYKHTPQLPGSNARSVEEYNFSTPKCHFTVYNTAGGIPDSGDSGTFEKFKDVLSKASVIINVIDGAILMEGNPFRMEKINSPQRIKDTLYKYKKDDPCLILFVITKCEAWIKNNHDIKKLRKKFEEWYEPVMKWIDYNENRMGIFIPVQTTGCIEFLRNEGKDETEISVYRHISHELSPKDVEKPLEYAERYCMKQPMNIEDFETFGIYGKTAYLINKRGRR